MGFLSECRGLGLYWGRALGLADAAAAGRVAWLATDRLADLDIITPRVLLICAGSSQDVAMGLRVTASAEVVVDLYEGPTYATPGTAITLFNADRNAAGTCDAKVCYTPSTSADGTLIWSEVTGATINVPNPATVGPMFVLAANKNYLLRVTALADDTKAAICLTVIDDGSGAAATTTSTTTTTTTV